MPPQRMNELGARREKDTREGGRDTRVPGNASRHRYTDVAAVRLTDIYCRHARPAPLACSRNQWQGSDGPEDSKAPSWVVGQRRVGVSSAAHGRDVDLPSAALAGGWTSAGTRSVKHSVRGK